MKFYFVNENSTLEGYSTESQPTVAVDYFEEKQGYLTGIAIVSLISTIFAILSYHPIIWYERFGGDPMKRTVLNQLFSLVSLDAIFGGILLGLPWCFRALLGPLNFELVWLVFTVGKTSTCIFAAFAFLEYELFRYLSICIWRRMLPINDMFFGLFLGILNAALGLFYGLCQNIGDTHGNELEFMLSGKRSIHHGIKFKFYQMTGIVVLSAAAVMELQIFFTKRRINWATELPQSGAPRFNSQAKNKLISVSKVAVVHSIMGFLTIIPFFFFEVGDRAWLFQLAGLYILMVEALIVAPLIAHWQNPDIMKQFFEQ